MMRFAGIALLLFSIAHGVEAQSPPMPVATNLCLDSDKPTPTPAAAETAQCWKNIGIVLSFQGNFKDAIEPLQKATKLDPRDAESWFLLATAYATAIVSTMQRDRMVYSIPTGTADAYQKCIETDPGGPYAAKAQSMLKFLAAIGGVVANVPTAPKETQAADSTQNIEPGGNRGLEGSVLDPSGAGVADAEVVLPSDEGVITARTDRSGSFKFASLPFQAHFLEVSDPGFFSASLPITDETPERVAFTLGVAVYSGCPTLTKAYYAPPSASYEERSGDVQLTGIIADASDVALADTSLTLLKADLNAPLPTGQDEHRVLAMKERRFTEKVVAQVISNEKGEFQVSDLDSGWYTLRVPDGSHLFGRAKFWIARENLTKLSPIYLLPFLPCGYY